MPHDFQPTPSRGLFARAVRHHLALVVALLALGAAAGWYYTTSAPATYTSNARVLINPSVGNPFSATPSSVRQDEQTSLETEAQMVRSREVLRAVAQSGTGLTPERIASRLDVGVPPSTQILEISYSATDPQFAQQMTDAVAQAYLANREARFQQVKDERVGLLETQTVRTVEDLRAATAAAQKGSAAVRAFNNELADALRNELVNVRAQRTSLENLTSPAGAVISPASRPSGPPLLTSLVWPLGGAVAGLALACLLALLLERLRGVVRSAAEAQEAGLPVVASVRHAHLRHRRGSDRRDAIDSAVRTLRATILDLEPRPEVISVAGTSPDTSDVSAAEALAASFTKAGHRVVLVRPDQGHEQGDVAVDERGLAQLLRHERLDVHDVLRPSVDPLLSVLDGGGFTSESRELLTADRLRSLLAPLVDDGNIVVVHTPGLDTAEGAAFMGAADLGVVVVATSRTRRRTVDEIVRDAQASSSSMVALVVGRGDLRHRSRLARGADEPSDMARAVARHDSAPRART